MAHPNAPGINTQLRILSSLNGIHLNSSGLLTCHSQYFKHKWSDFLFSNPQKKQTFHWIAVFKIIRVPGVTLQSQIIARRPICQGNMFTFALFAHLFNHKYFNFLVSVGFILWIFYLLVELEVTQRWKKQMSPKAENTWCLSTPHIQHRRQNLLFESLGTKHKCKFSSACYWGLNSA